MYRLEVTEEGLLQLTGKMIVEDHGYLELEIRKTGPAEWEIVKSGFSTLNGVKSPSPADLLRYVAIAVELHTKPDQRKLTAK